MFLATAFKWCEVMFWARLVEHVLEQTQVLWDNAMTSRAIFCISRRLPVVIDRFITHTRAVRCETSRRDRRSVRHCVVQEQYSVDKNSTFSPMSYVVLIIHQSSCWVTVSEDGRRDGNSLRRSTVWRWTLTLQKGEEHRQEEEPKWLTHAVGSVDVPPGARFCDGERQTRKNRQTLFCGSKVTYGGWTVNCTCASCASVFLWQVLLQITHFHTL